MEALQRKLNELGDTHNAEVTRLGEITDSLTIRHQHEVKGMYVGIADKFSKKLPKTITMRKINTCSVKV